VTQPGARDEGGLVAEEGVDQGSASATTESGPDDDRGVLGAPVSGEPVDGAEDAAPVDMESEDSRAARDAAGTGQQLQEGEG